MQTTWDKVGKRVIQQNFENVLFQSFKEPVETHDIDLDS